MSRQHLDEDDLPYAARAIEQSLDNVVEQLTETRLVSTPGTATNIVLREIAAALIDECRTCISSARTAPDRLR